MGLIRIVTMSSYPSLVLKHPRALATVTDTRRKMVSSYLHEQSNTYMSALNRPAPIHIAFPAES